MAHLLIRPTLLYAWKAQSLLVVDTQGDSGADETLSGFYYRETRHLRTLRLSLDGEPAWLCQAASEAPDVLRFDYVHPEMQSFGGGGSGQSGDTIETNAHGIPYRALDVRVAYRVGVAELHVELQVSNRSRREVSVEARWAIDADFADIQEAQGGERRQEAPVCVSAKPGQLRLAYGHSELPYATWVSGAGAGTWNADREGIGSALRLAPQESATLTLVVRPEDFREGLGTDEAERRDSHLIRWRNGLARLTAPGNGIFAAIVGANLRDFTSYPLLYGAEDEWLAPQAGFPVYPALFGRDALTAGWQAAWVDRGAMLDASLVRLGRLQSERVDDWRDEEPGRIPFQIRQGPLARLNLNPFSAYYADYASPLMFLISLAQLYAWTGDKARLARHWDTARRILDWARDYGDMDGDGYLEYQTRSSEGTKNQGWKDSGNAIVYEDGSAVPAPIATCELQGYWYAAQQVMSVLSWVMSARQDAREHWAAAQALRERFNRDWWMESERCVGLALDPEKRLVRAITSNAAQCITTGIISEEHLPPLVGRVFAPDLFSGWGIRTLSTGHVSYNPISYHLGSVWAVENATIVFGLRRFGFDDRALELSRALLDLAALYPDYRIPECVGGYARGEQPLPGAYPRANTPQLWNASGILLLVHSILGLQPVGPLNLLVVDPVLPTWLPELVLHDLHLGGSTATVRFWRDPSGASHAEVLHHRGPFHLVKQPPPESFSAGLKDRFSALVDSVLHH